MSVSTRMHNCFLLVLVLINAGTVVASETPDEKTIQVALRLIGHRLLLSTGDSTSRVLPIQKEKEAYIIRFEKPLTFDPDALILATNSALIHSKIAHGYVILVRTCEKKEIVHSYKVGKLSEEDMIPCKQRTLPKDCYELFITLSPVVAQGDAGEIPLEQRPYEPPLEWYIWSVVGTIVLILIIRARRRKEKAEDTEEHVVHLGAFRFDARKSEMFFYNERIELTGKEVALLELLCESVNTTVKREVILEKVWGDEGDYIGRTLDVFISRLRKKLEPDATIKIMNIRGVGYKLIVE